VFRIYWQAQPLVFDKQVSGQYLKEQVSVASADSRIYFDEQAAVASADRGRDVEKQVSEASADTQRASIGSIGRYWKMRRKASIVSFCLYSSKASIGRFCR